MATPETKAPLTENEQLAGINADYTERYGFHDAENYLYKADKGLTRQTVEPVAGRDRLSGLLIGAERRP